MRPFLIWREDWLLNHEMLDEQHLALSKTLNELHRFLVLNEHERQPCMAKLSQRLADLMEMARRHFQDEEALMRAHGFPGLSNHHREHVLLLAELQDCIREIEEGSKPFKLETLTALKYWQIDHVLNSDRMLADYLNDCNTDNHLAKADLRPSFASS